MFFFILGIVIILATIGAALYFGPKALGVAVLGAALIIVSMTTIVPTKQVGIPVTFGKPGAPLSNGFHWKAPWAKVIDMDATIQDVDNAGDNPTVVKDADDADLRVHNLVRWSIKEDAADSLYRDYTKFERVAGSLVQPEINTAIAQVMATYNPLEAEQPTYDQLATKIEERLQERVGDRIVIHSVSISLIDFSEATVNRINALNAERANTRIAAQKEETAAKEANANRVLSQSVSNDPNVLVANCLKAVESSPAGTFPAGFQCWPNAGGGVLVGQR